MSERSGSERPRNILGAPADAPPPHANPPGPYAVTVETDPGLPTHTLYYPTDLAAAGPLPIVVWGNGACLAVGRMFETFLTQVASHGYFVAAIGPQDAALPAFMRPRDTNAPRPAADAPRPAPGLAAPQSRASQLIDGLNWAIAETGRAGSRFEGRLAADRVAVMGQSCGGLQTIEVSHDPRVTTSVLWNSGVFPNSANMTALSGATKESLETLHAPIAYFIGGPTDVAYPNAEDDFARIKVPMFKANLNCGHGGTFGHPGGGWYGVVGVAWLDWRLKGDEAAGRMFSGPTPALSKDPLWAVERHGMD